MTEDLAEEMVYRPYVTTFSGKKIFIDKPDEDQICLVDIAHQLSMKVRFGGAIQYFYSVAQHSIYCMMLGEKMEANLPTRLALLLHDANEAAYPDVQRPIKVFLPQWKIVEQPLEDAIYNKYLGKYKDVVDWSLVKQIDNILLVLEAREYLEDSTWSYEPHWGIYFENSPIDFKYNDGLSTVDNSNIAAKAWGWYEAKNRFHEELDIISKEMVAFDPKWNTIEKEFIR